MSTWGVAGSSPLADLTKPIEELVRDLLFAQWSITDPDNGSTAEKASAAQVRFGLGWGTGPRNNHEIHCLHLSTLSEPAANGWRLYRYDAVVDVHVFVRRTGQKEPAQLLSMINEIGRIVAQKRLDLGQSVKPMRLLQWVRADDPDSVGTVRYWHRVAQVEAQYWMVDTG